MKILQELTRREKLVVAGAVHDLNLAARFADRLLLMRDGKALASGKREEVLTRENIAAAFGIAPEIVRSSAGHPVLLFD
jgi:iron complex transport system ATP-binding protein